MSKASRLVLPAAIAAAMLLFAACAGSEASSKQSQVDSGANTGFSAASLDGIEPDFEALFYCKNAELQVPLERYLLGAYRDVPIPSTSSPDYMEALPPICIVSAMGGVPPYSATAWVDGAELRRAPTSTTELTFRIPPLAPGAHKVEFLVTDANGDRGVGSAELETYWTDPNRIHADFTSPTARLYEAAPGANVEFAVDFEAHELSDQPQLGIEHFESQTYDVTWTFGDGAIETTTVTSRTGRLTASHTYDSQGLYDVTVVIEGQIYGQRGVAAMTVDVRPPGSTRTESGEVVQRWKLIETRVNPSEAPLRSNEVRRVFADDSLNSYVDRTASLNSTAITVNKATGKGSTQSFIGTYRFKLDSIPDLLTAGEHETFGISGTLVTVFGSDNAGEVLRLSGLPGAADEVLTVSSQETLGSLDAEIALPVPSSAGETIVITASVDGCPACVVELVYRYG